MPEYVPTEGIDYIIDFYKVVGIAEDAAEDDIKKAINKKQREYHPDRLEGLAPEFKARGERMAELMNRARRILVDPEKRAQYDELFNEWDGLVSTSGDAVITPNLYNQRKMSLMTPEEVDESLLRDDERVAVHVRDAQARVEFLEKMMETLGDAVTPEFRQQYEEALIEQDRSLAIRLSMREDILGITNGAQAHQDRIAPGYGEDVTLSLEATKTQTLADMRALALGGTAQKLAILSSAPQPEISKELVDPTTIQLPVYFEKVVEQVQDLANKRTAIVEKRLENLQVTYPEEELQTELQPAVIIGFEKEEEGYTWVVFEAELEKFNFNNIPLTDDIAGLLSKGDYASVIKQKFNIILSPVLEMVEIQAIMEEALNKYYQKYIGDTEAS